MFGIEHLQHAAWMVDEMLSYIGVTEAEHYDGDKVNRWIGFIQGVLWMYGVYTVDDLRQQTIRAKENKIISPNS